METGSPADRSAETRAASSGAGTGSGSRRSFTGGDWPAQAADAIVDTVGKVRDRTTGPIMKIARGLVFGVFIGTVAITITVLLIVGSIRLLDKVLPSGVWLAYLLLGLVFTIGGALVFRKRSAPSSAPSGKNHGR